MKTPLAKLSIAIPVVAAATAAGTSCADSAAAAVPDRPVRILAVGNSFSRSLCTFFPAVAAAAGRPVEFCNLFIGGCSLERHASNIRKAVEDPDFAPYEVMWFHPERPAAPVKFSSNVPQMLATQAWDFVTIQQASPKSWDFGTYRPAADEVVAEIRRLAPQAEIIVHQTWAYNARDGRFRGGKDAWEFGQGGMAARVEEAYKSLADAFGCRTIPVGAAVRIRREDLAAEGRIFDPASLDALAPGEKPDLRGDPVGNFWWKKSPSKDGEEPSQTLAGDTIHLNTAGEYLQALVWLGFFCGVDPQTVDFSTQKTVPFAADIPAIRSAAARALVAAGEGEW